MLKVTYFLASAAALGGIICMALIASAPLTPLSLPIFVVGLIIALGASSRVRRLARRK